MNRPPKPVIAEPIERTREVNRLAKFTPRQLAGWLYDEKQKAHAASSRVVHLEQQLTQAQADRAASDETSRLQNIAGSQEFQPASEPIPAPRRLCTSCVWMRMSWLDRFFRVSPVDVARCGHPLTLPEDALVDGSRRPNLWRCDFVRHGQCGPDGKLWQQRP